MTSRYVFKTCPRCYMFAECYPIHPPESYGGSGPFLLTPDCPHGSSEPEQPAIADPPKEPPIDWAAEDAHDRWARNEAQAEADELQAEEEIAAEMADMMALALTEDLPPDLQEVCEFFI